MWRLNVMPSCTPDELIDILTAPTGGYRYLPMDPYNEVYPGIFVGDAVTALSLGLLKRLGVTHVLNAAQGTDREFYVNTNHSYYKDRNIKFLGVPALDMMSYQLSPYFESAAAFIQEALDNNGKVLVHCRQGISRSSSLVLAYLMIKKNMSAQEACRKVRQQREILPNDGFLHQLCFLNETLVNKRRKGSRTAL